MHVDEAAPEVIRVAVTDKRQVLEEHAHIWDRRQLCGSQLVTVVLVVPLQPQQYIIMVIQATPTFQQKCTHDLPVSLAQRPFP